MVLECGAGNFGWNHGPVCCIWSYACIIPSSANKAITSSRHVEGQESRFHDYRVRSWFYGAFRVSHLDLYAECAVYRTAASDTRTAGPSTVQSAVFAVVAKT